MPVPFEGTANYPKDAASVIGPGWYNEANGFFYAPRTDNATAKNLRVALYDAAGNPLLVAANPGVVNLTQVNGVPLLAGAGNTGTGSPRVTIASDQAPVPVTLGADTDVIGRVGIDQTTPGTTDRVTVGGTAVLAVAAVVSISPAYTAGDQVGAKLTIANAVRVSGGTGIIQSVTIADKGKQSAALDLIFWNANPGSTFTDNGAFTMSDADLLTVIGVIPILTTDYVALVDNSVATKYGIGLPFKIASGTTLYAGLVARSTPTYASTSDLQVLVGLLQD